MRVAAHTQAGATAGLAACASILVGCSFVFGDDPREDPVLTRVPGQSLAGATPSNNLGFEVFEFSSIKAIGGALLGADFGLRHRGTDAERRPPDLGESRRASPPTQVGRPEPTVPVIRNRTRSRRAEKRVSQPQRRLRSDAGRQRATSTCHEVVEIRLRSRRDVNGSALRRVVRRDHL
jgi:hypothetical protein